MCLELHYCLVKILTNYKIDLKHAVTMLLRQEYFFDMYLELHKILFSKSEEILSYTQPAITCSKLTIETLK